MRPSDPERRQRAFRASRLLAWGAVALLAAGVVAFAVIAVRQIGLSRLRRVEAAIAASGD